MKNRKGMVLPFVLAMIFLLVSLLSVTLMLQENYAKAENNQVEIMRSNLK